MKHRAIIIGTLLSILFVFQSNAQQDEFPVLKGPYLGQKPPGMTPITFAPHIISKKEYHEGCSGFMRGGTLFIFSPIIPGSDWRYKPTYFLWLKDRKWTKPEIVPFNNLSPYNFTVAPDGHTLYFTSLRSETDSSILLKKSNIWTVQFGNRGWTEAKMLGPEVNSVNYGTNYPSISNSDNIYYSSNQPPCLGNGDIFFSEFAGDKFLSKQNLGEAINTKYSEDDPFIASDESFLIFCSDRPGGLGSYDLYISFQKKDGTWTKAKNMGPEINTSGEEARPSITPDGKYFFFTRGDVNPDWRDIFWVDATIIEEIGKEILGASAQESENLKKAVNDGYGDYLFIPAGEFETGDNFNEGFPDEHPVHRVYLSDYYMGKYEMTNAEYKKFMDANGHESEAHWRGANFGFRCVREK